MPIYGDDQCEVCGGIRVAKSTLCAGCLVTERDFLEKEVLIKMIRIEAQRKRIANLKAVLKAATVYGFKRNQENVQLYRYLGELEGEIAKEVDDEKGGT